MSLNLRSLNNCTVIRAAVFIGLCSLIFSLSACSDSKENDVPVGNTQTSSTPAQKTEPEAHTDSSLPTASPAPSSGGPCASLTTAKCIECHSMARVCEKLGKKSKSRWKRTINRMIDRGAKISADESAALLDCLDSGIKDLQSVCQ